MDVGRPITTCRTYGRRRRPWSSVVALFALGSVVALSAGAERAGSGTSVTSNGSTLRVAAAQDVDSLDPAIASGALAWGIEYGTCATLTAYADRQAPEGLTVRFEAAARPPRISRGGRTYAFTVRKGLRFSDGSPLRAGNFKQALSRVLSPAMHSPGAALFSDVKRVWARGRQLRIELSQRSGSLLERLALPYACPVPSGFPINQAGVPLMVGSGPYYVATHVPDNLIVVKRNPYYRGARPHRIDRLEMTVNGDLAADERAVEQEQADVLATDLPFSERNSLAQRYGVNRNQLFKIRGTVVYFLALNTASPLFSDNVPLRKAVNLALNRGEIVRAAPGWPRSHTATDQIIPSWVPGWKDLHLYPIAAPNLQLAQSLAAPNTRGGRAVLYTSAVPALASLASVIAGELSQIGLHVTVTPLAPGVIDAKAGTRGAPYDLLLTRYDMQYPDPADVMIKLLAGKNARRPAGNTNLAYFDNPTYNLRMAAADRLSGAARTRAFSQVDASIMRHAAPWAPLFEGSRWLFVSSRVGCLKVHPVFRLDYAGVCLQ